ncbi:uncharacterized protein METZ01_LOCUS13174, partial [marine metagenome]
VEIVERPQVQRARIELNGALESQAAAEAMPVDYGSLSILSDVPINLLLGLLARELEIGPEEVLGVYPRAWHPVDPDIVEQQQVGGDYRPSLALLLLGQQVLLTTESHSDGVEVVTQDVLEDLSCALGVTLVDRANPVH